MEVAWTQDTDGSKHLDFNNDYAEVFKAYVQLLRDERKNSVSVFNPAYNQFLQSVGLDEKDASIVNADWLKMCGVTVVSGVGVHVKESGHQSSEAIIDEIKVQIS